MHSKKNRSSYFLDKIANFDFDRLSTKKNRLLLHVGMWSAFSILLFLSYRLAYHITVFNSLILTARMALANATIFYAFFYALVPIIVNGSKYRSMLLLFFSYPVLIFIWLTVTYSISLLYHLLGFEISNGELKGAIAMAAAQPFLVAVSLNRMVAQSIIIISLLSPFFFVKILYEISKIYSENLKIQNQKRLLQIQNVNIERDFLKAQLNPHFLFNTLNNLYGLTLKKDDLAPEAILNLSDIMSYTLYESNCQRVKLQKELEFVENYFELEKMRYSKDKYIQSTITFCDSESKLTIAPLLMFTFIENAFKYGLQSTKHHFIKMIITVDHNIFHFQIENDWCPQKASYAVGGIGLDNIKRRLELLYPEHYCLQIKKDDVKFVVSLTINLEQL